MKRGFVFLLIIVLCSSIVQASLWDFLMSALPPKETTLISSFSDPIKVYPGQTLKVVIELEDTAGITDANAFFYHEKGKDKVPLTLIASNEKTNHYTYAATWEVHDTLNLKWYKTDFEIKNKKGKILTGSVDWQDPTQSHPAAEVAPGTFPAGDFTFQGDVTAGTFYGSGFGLTGIAASLTSGNSQAVPWSGIIGRPALQNRVSGTCPAGSSIRAISDTGTVTCETDNVGSATLSASYLWRSNSASTAYKVGFGGGGCSRTFTVTMPTSGSGIKVPDIAHLSCTINGGRAASITVLNYYKSGSNFYAQINCDSFCGVCVDWWTPGCWYTFVAKIQWIQTTLSVS